MINLSNLQLKSALESVFSGAANYALFTIDKTDTCKVSSTGTEDWEEVLEDLDQGRIQYALLRVLEPISQLPKIVLISWCGEGVPVQRKGLYHQHLSDMTNFFKGYHLHIQARCAEDVDPATILKKVKDASGAKYSIHKEAAVPEEAPTPVKSVYTPIQTAPKPLSASGSPSIMEAPSLPPSPMRPVFSKTSFTLPEKNEETPQQDWKKMEQERKERLEKERLEEQERVNRDRATQALRERQEKEKREQEQLKRQEQERREQERIQRQEQEERERCEKQNRQRQEQERLERERQAQSIQKTASPIESQPTTSLQGTVLYDYDKDEDNEISLREGELITSIVEQEGGWYSGTNSRGETGFFPGNYVELSQVLVQETPVPEAPSIKAIALYDYQAAEDNEISFATGDHITDITYTSDDWWHGNVNGAWGLFPGNYVEIQK